MGEIVSNMRLENDRDRGLFEAGHIEEREIRFVEVEGVVDTGCRPGLALPQGVVDRLGVRVQREMNGYLADGRRTTLDVVGPINITIEGRTTVVDAFALPEEGDPLIGQIVLERLDLLADCARQRLVVPPETPDRPVLRL
jgi:clan AA aspartic protease